MNSNIVTSLIILVFILVIGSFSLYFFSKSKKTSTSKVKNKDTPYFENKTLSAVSTSSVNSSRTSSDSFNPIKTYIIVNALTSHNDISNSSTSRACDSRSYDRAYEDRSYDDDSYSSSSDTSSCDFE